MRKSPLRVLVLTSRTGGGHDARADAFDAWCNKLYDGKVEVRIERPLEKASAVTHFGVGCYNFIQEYAPILHNPYWWIIEIFGYLQRNKIKFGKAYFEHLLKEFRPHLVFSVHDFLNRGYFQAARSVLGDQVRCATYCGEFSGGFGYSKNWVEPSSDLYFSRTDTAQDYAIQLGMAPEKCHVRGNLMHPSVYDGILNKKERRDFLVNDLGLSPNKLTIFLTAGGMGSNNHLEMLRVLKRYSSRVQAILVCGRNQSMVTRVQEWNRRYPDFQLYVEGYSIRMHHHIQVSDAIISRGATTCAEALFFGVPIIFNAIGGIMPQERLTFKYFYRAGAAVKISNMDDVNYQLGLWLSHKREYVLMQERCREIGVVEDPTKLIDEIIDLAKEASGEE
ncbi:MAG: glycosyltransferase [Verrucomicrobia bacterium]|nr:glycosyltransferase [Verrucomicrobiota bacterium]